MRTLFAALVVAAPLAAQQKKVPELWLLDEVVQQAITKVGPAVVTIETFGGFRKQLGNTRPRPKPDEGDEGDDNKKKSLGPIVMPGFLQAQGPGTGLIIGAEGWVVTSSFVLNYDPQTILVTLQDGRRFTAEVRGEDRSRGLAMLKVKAEELPVAEILPAQSIEVGQWVFALARTFGAKRPTVHVGVVSALRRISGRALQCDANTSPANYGGPLIDIEGRVMGIVSPLSPKGALAGADWYDSGIGFAVTLGDIPEILEGMKAGEVYRKGFLGVSMDQAHLGPGAKIMSITKRSPAQHANFRKGDMVIKVDGVAVKHSMHLQDLIGGHVAGAWVTVVVKRKNGDEVEVLVQLDSPPPPKPPPPR